MLHKPLQKGARSQKPAPVDLVRAKEESESELVNEIGERSKRVTAIAAAVQLECDQHNEDGGEKRLFLKRKTK